MSADDDQKTPPRGTRPPTTQERRDHAALYHSGVPVVETGLEEEPDDDEPGRFTAPVDMYDAELKPEETAVVRRLRHESNGPMALLDRLANAVGRLTVKLDQQKRREYSNNKQRTNQLLEVVDRVPSEAAAEIRQSIANETAERNRLAVVIDKRLDKIEMKAGIGTWIFRTIAGGTFAILVWAATQISDRSEASGEMKIKVQHLEATVGDLKSEISALRSELRQDQRDQRDERSRRQQP